MAIHAVQSTASGIHDPPAPTNQLGKQEFLQLLVAQLRNQDPLRPMEDREFIAQLAQLTTMETLQRMQSTLESMLGAQLLSHAMGLIGHNVTAIQPGGEMVTGTVQGVRLEGAEILLDLGSTSIYLSDVQAVQTAASGG